MKRLDETRVIKVTDASTPATSNAQQQGGSVVVSPVAVPPKAVAALLPTRPVAPASDMPPQQPLPASASTTPTGGAQAATVAVVPQPAQGQPTQPVASATGAAQPVAFTRVMPHGSASVSVYREGQNASGVAITAVAAQPQSAPAINAAAGNAVAGNASSQPPAAHTANLPANLQQQPAAATQPAGSLTPESITLPTTPVSVQYGAFPQSLAAVKTLSTTPAPAGAATCAVAVSAQSIVQGLQQQQQVVKSASHPPTLTLGPPGKRRRPVCSNFYSLCSVGSTMRLQSGTAPLPSVPASGGATPASTTPVATAAAGGGSGGGSGVSVGQGSAQFQRLKVEDALSYLDQVIRISRTLAVIYLLPQQLSGEVQVRQPTASLQ